MPLSSDAQNLGSTFLFVSPGSVPVAHLKGKRSYKFVDISACPELQEEVAYVKQDGCVEEKVRLLYWADLNTHSFL